MVVLIEESGNHSNRLIQHLHFEAYCLRHNITFINPTLYNIEKYYNYKPKGYNKYLLFFLNVAKRINLKIPSVNFLNDYKKNVTAETFKKPLLFVKGWYFREHALVKEYQTFFSRKYALKKLYYRDNILHKKIMSIDRQKVLLVGVHIRRGDYAHFKEGVYFYDDAIYRVYMNKLKLLLIDRFKKDVKFIIFSNDTTSFENSENIFISENDWYIDHHLMSKCDYLIGPPSSFTLWASYIGSVPFYHLKSKNDEVLLENFLVSDL